MEAIDLPTADTAESAPDTTNNTAPLDPCSSLALWAGLLDISNRRTLRRVANERMSGPPVRKPNSAHPARMFTRSLAASVDRSPSSVRAPTNQRHWNSRLHPRGLSRAYPGTGYVPGNWALGSWACLSDMNDDARRILSFFFFFFFCQFSQDIPLCASGSKVESWLCGFSLKIGERSASYHKPDPRASRRRGVSTHLQARGDSPFNPQFPSYLVVPIQMGHSQLLFLPLSR